MSSEVPFRNKNDLIDFIVKREFNFIKDGFTLAFNTFSYGGSVRDISAESILQFSIDEKSRCTLCEDWLNSDPEFYDVDHKQRDAARLSARLIDLNSKSGKELLVIADILESHDIYDLNSRGAIYDEYQFYSMASSSADFEYWCKMDLWTAEEAVALSLSKDPSKVNGDSLPTGSRSNFSPFVSEYRSRLNMTNRAIKAGQLTDPISPIAFLLWSRERFTCSAELVEPVEARAKKKVNTAQRPKGISYLTLYKLAVGMAILNYGLPADYAEKKGSSAPGDISNALQAVGLKTSEKTVREALAKAIRYLAEKGLPPKPARRSAAPVKTVER